MSLLSKSLIPVCALWCALLATAALNAQDILYYKFDAGGGSRVINYAAGPAKGPAEGLLKGNASLKQRWAAGRFGGALLGGDTHTGQVRQNYVASGWDGAFSGSFTTAWFMKLRGTQDTSLSYLFSGIGSFRCFTNGVAKKGLMLRGWGGIDLTLTTDVQARAKKGWTHVALVVDDKSKTATWFLDGKSAAVIRIKGSPKVAKGSSFFVGMHSFANYPFAYDLDEFRFSNRAVSSQEILAWSLASRAADAPYGKGCGGTLGALHPGQLPTVGQVKYGLLARFSRGGIVAAMLGVSRHSLLGQNLLPLDLGGVFPTLKGCLLENSLDLVAGKLANSGGTLSLPLPIPNDNNLSGATLYSQCLLLVSGKEQLTNGWAISIR